jgi:hypothetical protein
MQEAQVDRALCICTTLEEFAQVHALALAHDNFWCSVGVHPDNEGVTEPTLDDLLTRAAMPRVVAIGETGLDYYRLGERTVADMEWQRERFRTHIRAARQTGKPLVIHEQNAVPGLANRVLAGVADRVLSAFPDAFEGRVDVIWSGNPIRAEIVNLAPPEARFANRSGPLRLLIVGGSLGARGLNEIVPQALALLPAQPAWHRSHHPW